MAVSRYLKEPIKAVLPTPALDWYRGARRKAVSVYRQLAMRQEHFENREGFQNFNFSLQESREKDGISALLRIKNESSKIHCVLSSILELFDEIVIVDNDSTDGTMEIVRDFKQRKDAEDKIKLYAYPFQIARCGPEHAATPEDSIHNLAYYYNWALSRCSLRYVCKWDGDMLVRKESRPLLKQRFKDMQIDAKKCWGLYGQTVYRDLEGNFYLSDEINWEPRVFPYGLNPRFRKVPLYEALVAEPELPGADIPGVSFYELKFVDENEFSHLSISDFPSERKQKETRHFESIKRGDAEALGLQKLPATFLEDQADGCSELQADPCTPGLFLAQSGIGLGRSQ
jgi:Beta-1,4-N-acetylgalactosaminyltransferase (CgtA)